MRFAARLAAGSAAGELIVLTIARGIPGHPDKSEGDGVRRRAERILEGAARKMRGRRGRVAFRLVAARPTAPVPETISREADRLKADLVVVGSEGRDTLNEWVLGGVALRLVYVSRRPVAVVRPSRRRKTA